MLGELCPQLNAVGAHHEGLVEHAIGVAVAFTRAVVVALQELGPQRQHLFFQPEHGAVDQRQALARISQPALLGVARCPLGGEIVFAEVGVALQHNLAVRVVLHHHEGAAAHRPPVQCEVAVKKAGVVEEAIHLRGDGRKEVHGQPVTELRIAALDGNAEGALIHHLQAVHAVLVEVHPAIAGDVLEALGESLHPHNVLRHESEHGRGIERVGQPFDGIDIIVGGDGP